MSEKVLLVDDEEDFLDAMATRMKDRGMEVSTTTSAADALKKVEQDAYDAVVLDLMMPEMDGLEVLKAMKAKRPELQIILLTGHATVQKGVEAMKFGAMDFIEKPADLKLLTEKIHQASAQKTILMELASVGELAAGIAHEINNPVAIMVEEAGWIGDLLKEEEFKESRNLNEFKRALDQICTQGKRCKNITHKLLSFARRTDPREQDVQMNDLLEELVALSAERAEHGNISIKTDFQKTLPTVMVSQSEMQQVFLNLINNSIDAMETRGGVIEIKTRLQGNELVVEVIDNGPGIERANLGRIFFPFFTTKPVGKGTGLGLSICYGIINKYGGEIEVNSIPEVETTFRVKIPFPKDRLDRSGTQRAAFERSKAQSGGKG